MRVASFVRGFSQYHRIDEYRYDTTFSDENLETNNFQTGSSLARISVPSRWPS
jgi:hypothetical protein